MRAACQRVCCAEMGCSGQGMGTSWTRAMRGKSSFLSPTGQTHGHGFVLLNGKLSIFREESWYMNESGTHYRKGGLDLFFPGQLLRFWKQVTQDKLLNGCARVHGTEAQPLRCSLSQLLGLRTTMETTSPFHCDSETCA